jgi:hypothetical protein
MVEKCSRGDMELKLFLAPLDRACGDARDDQSLVWVGVERWDCGSGSGSGSDTTVNQQAPPVRERSCCRRRR